MIDDFFGDWDFPEENGPEYDSPEDKSLNFRFKSGAPSLILRRLTSFFSSALIQEVKFENQLILEDYRFENKARIEFLNYLYQKSLLEESFENDLIRDQLDFLKKYALEEQKFQNIKELENVKSRTQEYINRVEYNRKKALQRIEHENKESLAFLAAELARTLKDGETLYEKGKFLKSIGYSQTSTKPFVFFNKQIYQGDKHQTRHLASNPIEVLKNHLTDIFPRDSVNLETFNKNFTGTVDARKFYEEEFFQNPGIIVFAEMTGNELIFSAFCGNVLNGTTGNKNGDNLTIIDLGTIPVSTLDTFTNSERLKPEDLNKLLDFLITPHISLLLHHYYAYFHFPQIILNHNFSPIIGKKGNELLRMGFNKKFVNKWLRIINEEIMGIEYQKKVIVKSSFDSFF